MTYRLLIVDDDAALRRLLRYHLGDAFEVKEAGDGAAALDTMRLWRPHAVFLDIAMPGKLGGLDVLKTLRQDLRLQHTHVTLVSGIADLSLPQDIAGLMNAYIQKPFTHQSLLAWVTKFLQEAQYNEEESQLQSLFSRL